MAKLLIFASVLLIAYGSLADCAATVVSSSASTIASTDATNAIALVNQTISAIESAAAAVKQQATEAVVTLNNAAQSTLSTVAEKIYKIRFAVATNKVALESAGGSCNVTSCSNKLNIIETNSESLVSYASSCTGIVLDEANEYLNTIDYAVEDTVSSLNEYSTKIKACVANVSTATEVYKAIICVDELEIKVAESAISVIESLQANITEIEDTIVALEGNLATCAVGHEISALAKSESLLHTKANACVAQIVKAGSCA